MKQIRHIVICLATALMAITSSACFARAPRSHALLVGVSQYAVSSWPPLPGVANDVALMRETLLKRGFSSPDIRILANGFQADWITGAPTRESLISEFRRMRKIAQKGDLVVFYFAGHGSQTPAWRGRGRAGEEPDGFDEIILMADAGPWLAESHSVTNAILDDEIDQEFISALRGNGINTVAIFDTCHAESMTKAWQEKNRLPTRSLSWQALGIPARWMAALDNKSDSSATNGAACKNSMQSPMNRASGPGDLVALYAVAENLSAPEGLFKTAEGPRQYGVFTWRLVQELSSHPDASYRELVFGLKQVADRGMVPCAHIDGVLGNRSALRALR